MVIYNRYETPIFEAGDGIKDFDGLNLIEANFTGLKLEGAGFDSCNLVRADFTNADLYGARFYDVNCAGAWFKGASLRGASMYNTNFAGADLTDVDLGKDNLNGTATLEGTNFYYAKMTGANLSGALLSGANLTNATYDSQTIFPEGFSPEAAGMVRVPSANGTIRTWPSPPY